LLCFVDRTPSSVEKKQPERRRGRSGGLWVFEYFYETTISEYRPVTRYLFMAEPDWVRYGSGSGQTCFYKSKARTDHVIQAGS